MNSKYFINNNWCLNDQTNFNCNSFLLVYTQNVNNIDKLVVKAIDIAQWYDFTNTPILLC